MQSNAITACSLFGAAAGAALPQGSRAAAAHRRVDLGALGAACVGFSCGGARARGPIRFGTFFCAAMLVACGLVACFSVGVALCGRVLRWDAGSADPRLVDSHFFTTPLPQSLNTGWPLYLPGNPVCHRGCDVLLRFVVICCLRSDSSPRPFDPRLPFLPFGLFSDALGTPAGPSIFRETRTASEEVMMVEEKRPARTGTLRALRAQVVGTRAGYDVRVGFGDAFFLSSMRHAGV